MPPNVSMQYRGKVYLNGKFVNASEAKILACEEGFLFGLSLFETMRAYKQKIIYLRQHLERIEESSKLIGIRFPFSRTQLRRTMAKVINLNHLEDAYLRLTVWKTSGGTGILVMAKKYQPYRAQKYRAGFSAGLAHLRQEENSLAARIKSTNRILYQLSLKEARDRGFDEAILLNRRGYITEGSRTNIFFIKDGVIFTPALSCGCLNGVTRSVILDLAKKHRISLYEGDFTIPDLIQADEAFLTNSLIGLMPLTSLEKYKIAKARCGKLTEYLRKKYLYLPRTI